MVGCDGGVAGIAAAGDVNDTTLWTSRDRDGVPGTVATQEPGEPEVGEPNGWDGRTKLEQEKKNDEVNLQCRRGGARDLVERESCNRLPAWVAAADRS